MSRPLALASLAAVVVLIIRSPALAGPADLLKQAIEENEGLPEAQKAAAEAEKLVSEADRLAAQERFNEAIDLYERAYRLSPTNESHYVRLLVARRAAGVMTEQDREALSLIEDQNAAAIEQTFRRVRLGIIQARQALRAGDGGLARTHLTAAQAELDALPPYVDAGPYRQEVRSLLVAAHRKAGKDAPMREPGPAMENLEVGKFAARSSPGAGEPANPPTLGDAGEAAMVPAGGGAETGEIVDVERVLGESWRRNVYDREVTEALRRQRAEVILSNNEAALATPGMTFPADWREKSHRRARYSEGVIYESKPRVGEDGKTYITAIYDLGDLVHPVPNFYASYPGTARQQRIETLDRQYLRERSQIFNGWPEDLAAGLPLLHFFGGIDNNAVSMRTDPRETERIIRLLEEFIQAE